METLFGLLIVGYILFAKLFSITKNRNYDEQLRVLESEIWQLKNRLSMLEANRRQAAQSQAEDANPYPESNRDKSFKVVSKPERASSSPDDNVPETQQPSPLFATTAEAGGPEQVWTASTDEQASMGAAQPESAGIRPHAASGWEDEASDPVSDVIIAAKNWLFGGNTLVRSGIVILFIGISFLLKYAAEHTRVPIEVRIAGIELFGLALLVLGWRMRNDRTEYAWALQGGGIGVLYLSTFAAFKLYQLISPGAAFAVLIVIAILSAAIAVLQSAMPMALLGFTGGFLAPVFVSTGQGSHIGLFSYYLVLNLAIAVIAFYQSWRPLNVLGFVFTFIIGTLWGAKNYVPEYFASTEPFLVIHFLLFNGIAILYAHREAVKASDYVDSTLVFGTPIVGFSLQYGLLKDSHFGLAYSAVVISAFYLGLAWWLFNRKRETLEFLVECFLALGIGFTTLAIPLALDGRWTSAAWAVEGAGLVWAGLRQNRILPLSAGLALQLFGAVAFCAGWGLTGYSGVSHQNMFLGVAFIALSGWTCGALINAYRPNHYPAVTAILAFWGWLWWIGSGLTAIDQFLPADSFFHAGLLFIVITSVLLPYFSALIKWRELNQLTGLLLPVMAAASFIECFDTHPASNWGWLNWIAEFAVYLWLLARDKLPGGVWLRAPLPWLAAILGVKEWRYQMSLHVSEASVWHDIGWAIVPALIVAGICRWQQQTANVEDDLRLQSLKTWLWAGCAPLMAFLLFWFIYASLSASGYAAPLPYIPLLNPLDIVLTAVLLLFLIWLRAIRSINSLLTENAPVAAGLMGFALLNGMLLRSLHHWLGTPFEWAAIFTYPEVQMAFTFLWGLSAFMLMLLAHRKAHRQLWLAGAGLMALTVAKIFLLDLAQRGSIERIISFIGAGLILLIMGYFAPLPPAQTEEDTQ
jgi:uncharacterized membrane protein